MRSRTTRRARPSSSSTSTTSRRSTTRSATAPGAVAERVRACVRPADLAARLGGDEFGILIEHGSEEAAERIALRLVAALRAPFVLSGRETQVHASIGIASVSEDARTGDELLANADVAMYSAKSAGKRRYAFYEPRMHTRVRRRHELA